MLLLGGCCCWNDLKMACLAAALFTLVTSLVQILVEVAVFTADVELGGLGFLSSGSVIIYGLYLGLAGMDAVLAVTSGILLSAVELDASGVRLMLPWLVVLPLYTLYEATVNTYFFYSALLARQTSSSVVVTGLLGYLLVPLIYWITKLVLNIFGFLCVASRMQQLLKQAKVKDSRNTQDCSDEQAVSAELNKGISFQPIFSAYDQTNDIPLPMKSNAALYPKFCDYTPKLLSRDVVEPACFQGAVDYPIYTTSGRASSFSNVADGIPPMNYPMGNNFGNLMYPRKYAMACYNNSGVFDNTRRLPRTSLRIQNAEYPAHSGFPLAYNGRKYNRFQ